MGVSPVSMITSLLHSHISFIHHRRYMIFAIDRVIKHNTFFSLLIYSWRGEWNDHVSHFELNNCQHRVHLKQCS
jgi:hypothetical protein